MNGFIYHLHPDFTPSAYDFIYYRINNPQNPLSIDPACAPAWNKAAGMPRGIYQRPLINAQYTVAQNVDYVLQHREQIGGQSASTYLPYMFLAEYNMNLTQIKLYLTYVWEKLLNFDGAPKPLMFISSKRWAAIQEGANAMTVSANIASEADVCLTDYSIKLPPAVLSPAINVRAWEFNPGLMQYDVNGVFSQVQRPDDDLPPADDDPADDTDTDTHQFQCNGVNISIKIEPIAN
jgi:hypothetical protein